MVEAARVAEWDDDLAQLLDEARAERATTVDLPLPRALGPAVKGSMKTVINQMGDRFSTNMLQHLGTTTRGKPTRS